VVILRTEHISKQLFLKRIITLIIFTPILVWISTILLITIFGPFFENRFSDDEIRAISVIGSLILVILPMWIPFFRYKIESSDDRHKIEQIARVISQFDLNFEEAELINRAEGWDYQNDMVIHLNEEELKETFLLSKNIQIENESYQKGRMSTGIIASFIMSLIFIAGIQNWKTTDYWPMLCGIFLFGLSIYLFRTYRYHQLRIESLKEKIEKFKLNKRLHEDRS
jgi:hypothetical protein